MFLLDTNVISELRKAGDVSSWLSRMDASEFYLSAVTLMEVELGVLLVIRRDPVQGERLREWMNACVMPTFADRTMSVDAPVALCCARLHEPDPRPERVALIAVSALAHGMTVVTRNVADFALTGVPLVNPWES